MRIVACVKRVGALGDDVEFTDDSRAVDPDYLDFSLNEWDAYAVEEALRIREAAGGGEVVVVTVGDEDAEEVLVRCLAMGADRALRVESDEADALDSLALGRCLAEAVAHIDADLVLAGTQSSDVSHGSTGAALAAFLDVPCVAVVAGLEVDASGRSAVARRELEGGVLDVVDVSLPAVITVQTGINEPRYVTLRAIQQAELAEIETLEAAATRPAGYRVRRLGVPERSQASLIEGDSAAIAARISEIVREVAP